MPQWFDRPAQYGASALQFSGANPNAFNANSPANMSDIDSAYRKAQPGILSRISNMGTGALAPFLQAYGIDNGFADLVKRQQENEMADMEFQKYIMKQKSGIIDINSLLLGASNQGGEGFGPQISSVVAGRPRYVADTSADIYKRGSDLRKEFSSLPEVEDYKVIKTNVESMDSLLKKGLSGDVKNKVALDQGLITMYNKLTDPSSVVRESEYARTPENLPVVNQIYGAIAKVEAGGAGLTDSDRKALVQGAKIIADERGRTFNQAYDAYEQLSGQAKVKPERVLERFKKHESYFKPDSGKSNIPEYDPKTEKLQKNKTTGEYRVIKIGK